MQFKTPTRIQCYNADPAYWEEDKHDVTLTRLTNSPINRGERKREHTTLPPLLKHGSLAARSPTQSTQQSEQSPRTRPPSAPNLRCLLLWQPWFQNRLQFISNSTAICSLEKMETPLCAPVKEIVPYLIVLTVYCLVQRSVMVPAGWKLRYDQICVWMRSRYRVMKRDTWLLKY